MRGRGNTHEETKLTINLSSFNISLYIKEHRMAQYTRTNNIIRDDENGTSKTFGSINKAKRESRTLENVSNSSKRTPKLHCRVGNGK